MPGEGAQAAGTRSRDSRRCAPPGPWRWAGAEEGRWAWPEAPRRGRPPRGAGGSGSPGTRATMEVSLSSTRPWGTPPRRTRQPRRAGRKSASVLAWVKKQAWAAECGRVTTRPKTLRTRLSAHRDRDGELPPVDLPDLSREVARALVGLGGQELGPDLLEVVLEDGDAAAIALGLQALPDDRGAARASWRRRERMASRKGSRRDGCRRPLVAGRLRQTKQAMDGGPAHAQSLGDRLLGESLSILQSLHLSPILHSVHTFPP